MAASPEGMLVFGGATGVSTFSSVVDETWFLTRGAWSQLAGEAPSPRLLPALGYDIEHDVMVLYGGFSASNTPLADTWVWDHSWSCVAGCD
jgi:hypothetical protein